VVVGENKERRKDTATRCITASTSRGGEEEEEERKRNGMGRAKVQVRLGAEAYGLSQVCGVDPDWRGVVGSGGTGASRGGYDPLCADQARHHKSQDAAETSLQAGKALLSLAAHMSALLLGLAIPGLGQKEERKNRRRLLLVLCCVCASRRI